MINLVPGTSWVQLVRKAESQRASGQAAAGSPRVRTRVQQSPAAGAAHRAGSERVPGKSGHAAMAGAECSDWAHWDALESPASVSSVVRKAAAVPTHAGAGAGASGREDSPGRGRPGTCAGALSRQQSAEQRPSLSIIERVYRNEANRTCVDCGAPRTLSSANPT